MAVRRLPNLTWVHRWRAGPRAGGEWLEAGLRDLCPRSAGLAIRTPRGLEHCSLRPHGNARLPPGHSSRVCETHKDAVAARVKRHRAGSGNEHAEGWRVVRVDLRGHGARRRGEAGTGLRVRPTQG